MIQIGKWLLLYIWLLLLGVVQVPCAVLDASQNRVWGVFNIGYDAIDHAGVDYDGPEKLSSAYDVAPSRAQTDNERRIGAQRASFALFSRLLAAEGTTTLWRSVSAAELRDVGANGLRQSAGSMGNKLT